jgi:hypothetical protein
VNPSQNAIPKNSWGVNRLFGEIVEVLILRGPGTDGTSSGFSDRLPIGRIGVSLTRRKWLEIAQKMAQAARAGLAIERKRLNEILAEQRRKPVSSSSQSSR